MAFTTIHLGATDTGMGAGARRTFLTESEAVRKIVRAMDRRAGSLTIPRMNRLLLELTRLIPDALFSRLTAGAFPLPKQKSS